MIRELLTAFALAFLAGLGAIILFVIIIYAVAFVGMSLEWVGLLHTS